MIQPRRLTDLDPAALDRLLRRGRLGDPAVTRGVATLIEEVRADGDAALRAQALRFDGVALDTLDVPRSAWTAALDRLAPELAAALESAAAAIRRFHESQRPEPQVTEPRPGLVLGRRPDPLRRIGVYAPGGRAAYPSSVLMGVVPARVAGVEDVTVCSPAGADGLPSALVMAACAVAGAERLVAAGGAGAIAALALGTASVPAVDRIVGPGNAWVAEAKRQVSTMVGIDSPAGPSELLVVADADADPVTIALEMLAQAEHDPDAAAVLVATDERVAADTAAELDRRAPLEPRARAVVASLAAAGAVLVADDLDRALGFAERYAPEHLLLLVADPADALHRTRSAGTVFLGPFSSVAFGDYATGANHVLPTGGLARSYSGLSLDDFVRWTTWQAVDPAAAADLAATTVPLAEAEGLPAHAAAARRAARAAVAAGAVTARASAAGASAEQTPPTRPGGGSGPDSPATSDRVRPRAPYRSLELYDPARTPVEVDLSANTNLWGPCPAALEAVASAAGHAHYPTPYADGLKRAIAEAWDVEPGQVVTGCGSDDVIDSALRAYCEPGAVVAFPAPTFPMAAVFARMNDARPRPVPLGTEGELDDRALATLAGADVAYVCRPNNPTGAVIPRARMLELLDRARGLALLDEAYGEYAGESLLDVALASGRAVVLRTFSKAYGLAGLRVGYALGPERLVRVIERSRGPYKVGVAAERAAIAALRHGDGWTRDVVRRSRAAREALAGQLRERGLRVIPSHANFLLVAPTAPAPAGEPAPGTGWAAAVRAALLERGVAVRAFPNLPGVGDAVRVTVGPEPLMDRFLQGLDAALRGRVEVA